jgi:hypothetical protein
VRSPHATRPCVSKVGDRRACSLSSARRFKHGSENARRSQANSVGQDSARPVFKGVDSRTSGTADADQTSTFTALRFDEDLIPSIGSSLNSESRLPYMLHTSPTEQARSLLAAV